MATKRKNNVPSYHEKKQKPNDLHDYLSSHDDISSQHSCCVLSQLPSEIFVELFEYLNGCELLKNVSKVCKNWYNIISHKLDWKLLVERRLHDTNHSFHYTSITRNITPLFKNKLLHFITCQLFLSSEFIIQSILEGIFHS